MSKLLSMIIPCFNEEETVGVFFKEFKKATSNVKEDIELIFVDDGSKDNTLEEIKKLNDKKIKVRYISFSRNFGKEAAMMAGLREARGDYVGIMDVDLQDPPEKIEEMLGYLGDDVDVVATRRSTRTGEPIIRSFLSKMFYKIINKLSKLEMVDGARDFRIMKRSVVDAINSLNEYNRYSKGIFPYVGFKTKWIEFENKTRVAGETKWSSRKLFKYAIDGIVDFSDAPLNVASFIGFLIMFISFIFIIVIIVKTLIFGDPVGGWPSLACIILFLSGTQLLCMGIIGKYLSKTYLETKNRPVYIVREKN